MKTPIIVGGAIVATVTTVLALGTGIAFANPSVFITSVKTSSATTSPAYLTAGISTSTLPVFNSYTQTVQGGVQYKADFAGLLIRFAASSTASILNYNVEYSDDGIDWYRNFVLDASQLGTTTVPTSLATSVFGQWKFASSTVGGIGLTNANSATSTAAITIPTPFRYLRVFFSVTGDNGTVWAQLVPVRERP